MRLLHTSFLIGTFSLASACGSPDVKLGDGNQNQVSGGAGGTAGSAGSGGSSGSGGSPGLCVDGVIGESGICATTESLKAQAVELCSAQNLTLAEIGYDGACDPGSAMFAKVSCCGDTPPPPPPGECIFEVAGDPGQCSSNSALKDQAGQKCAAANLQLVDIAYDNACGEDSSSFAKFVCCAGGEPPPPPPEPCFGTLIGDPVTCTDNKELSAKAWYLCDGAGATLTGLSFEDACTPDSSHYATVECCFAPPPPPPGECFGDFIGDPSVCTDNESLKDKAASLCESQNAALSDFTTDDACGPGSSYTAKFTCCTTSPPPPEPPPVCSEHGIASSTCIGNAELANQAKDVCGEINAGVEGLVFDDACGPNGSQSAKFVCCADNPPAPEPGCWSAGMAASECADNDTFKQMANSDCGAIGAELAKIGYDNSCGPNGSTSAEYTCCSPVD